MLLTPMPIGSFIEANPGNEELNIKIVKFVEIHGG